MRIPLALVADYANVSNEGKLNVMGIFDRIFTSSFPAVHLNAYLVLSFVASPAELGVPRTLRIPLIDQDGQQISDFETTMTIPRETAVASPVYQIIRIEAMMFSRAGEYSFRVLLNDDEKATVPFTVSLLERTDDAD